MAAPIEGDTFRVSLRSYRALLLSVRLEDVTLSHLEGVWMLLNAGYFLFIYTRFNS